MTGPQLIAGEHHLRTALDRYTEHYNTGRPHRSLGPKSAVRRLRRHGLPRCRPPHPSRRRRPCLHPHSPPAPTNRPS
ncbi:integrase core domain-containing protein [Streptomyces sp. NBC_00009]|uniref:integrase core domain-containing protein n=1 Tax=Streptomyces sp. NBC_00009 TaxID=2975620 RepID=UPI0038636FF8